MTAVWINGHQILTTVAETVEAVDHVLNIFLPNAVNHKNKVVGLDTQRTLGGYGEEESLTKSSEKRRTTILQLCDGKNCLIIQLHLFYQVPISLFNFLRLPDFTFFGIGIKENMTKLEKEYGLGCRNAVDLGPFAADVMRKPNHSACGSEGLISRLESIDFYNQKPTCDIFKDGGVDYLSEKQFKCATTDVYYYFKVGNKLLGM